MRLQNDRLPSQRALILVKHDTQALSVSYQREPNVLRILIKVSVMLRPKMGSSDERRDIEGKCFCLLKVARYGTAHERSFG
jgi:hypothetical protein